MAGIPPGDERGGDRTAGRVGSGGVLAIPPHAERGTASGILPFDWVFPAESVARKGGWARATGAPTRVAYTEVRSSAATSAETGCRVMGVPSWSKSWKPAAWTSTRRPMCTVKES